MKYCIRERNQYSLFIWNVNPNKITLVNTQTINTPMSSKQKEEPFLFVTLLNNLYDEIKSKSASQDENMGPPRKLKKKTQFFHWTTHFFYDSDILKLRYTQLLHMRIHIFDDSTHVLLCCLQKGYSTHQTLISKVQYLFLYHFNFSTSFNTPIQKWLQLTMSTLIELNQRYCSSPEIESSMTPWFLERL